MVMMMMISIAMMTAVVRSHKKGLGAAFSCLPDSNQQAGVTEDDDADGGGGGVKTKLTGKY